jgi:hypothetical protein
LKIICISNFVEILKLFIFRILFKLEKKGKEKIKTVNIMGRGPARHPCGRDTRPFILAPPRGGV